MRASLMMSDEVMPPDPFNTAPEELVTMMKGLTQLHSAAVLSGLPERTATQFIADVFLGFSMINNAQNAQQENPEET